MILHVQFDVPDATGVIVSNPLADKYIVAIPSLVHAMWSSAKKIPSEQKKRTKLQTKPEW